MRDVALIGSGRIGEAICALLQASGDYSVTLADISRQALERIPDRPGLTKRELDVADSEALTPALAGRFAVLHAGPYFLTEGIANAAKAAGVHYLDLTEDVAGARKVRALAHGADSAFISQCGLAPGFISIVANDMAGRFDALDTVSLRVGALPQYPANSLGYNLTWNTEGVINEYCEPCTVIENGVLTEVPPLSKRDEFSLDGITYESFSTSGGLGSLAETLAGRVRNLSYRTIRYPGHCRIMKTLLQDLRLADRRDLLTSVLEYAVPETTQDVVVILATISGTRAGRFMQESYAHKVYSGEIAGQRFSAIQITTAASICAMLDLLRAGILPRAGLVRQEDAPLDDFLSNRFGRHYDRDQTTVNPCFGAGRRTGSPAASQSAACV